MRLDRDIIKCISNPDIMKQACVIGIDGEMVGYFISSALMKKMEEVGNFKLRVEL